MAELKFSLRDTLLKLLDEKRYYSLRDLFNTMNPADIATVFEDIDEARLPLLVFGLALSIPIVIFGSNLLLKVMDRLPWIITVGAMLIGWIAGEMLAKEPLIAEAVPETWEILFPSAGALLVIGSAKLLQRLRKAPNQETRPAAQTED